MSVAEKPQVLQALAKANRIRKGRAEERKELHGASAERIEAALLKPSEALATYTLGMLLSPCRHGGGIVLRFGRVSLNRMLWQLVEGNPGGRRWSSETKLGNLTERERHLLVAALRPYLPKPSKTTTEAGPTASDGSS